MKLGTKSLLFGVHQFLIHPLLVIIAWIKLYHSLPSWRELVCIFIHDWGYWGLNDLKGADGDRHPEYGASLAVRWFDSDYGRFILGHSSFYSIRNNIGVSKLMAPDKYWHCFVPLWFYKLLSVPTGEFAHYRAMKHARQVAPDDATDAEWWAGIQKASQSKVDGTFKIDKERLSR